MQKLAVQPMPASMALLLLLLTCLFPPGCKQQTPSSTGNVGNNSSTGRFYQIRGFKMYVETYGNGQPLLLIHANGGSIRQFIHQIPYFSQKYRVIVADSRSQGRSPDNSDTLTYEMMADDFNVLLDSLGVDSACVIGWSDGGINGLLLAARHPKKVKKLAVTGANLWPDTSAFQPDFVPFLDSMYNHLKNIETKSDSIKSILKLTRLAIHEPHIPASILQTIICPTLVIGGDHDIIRPQHTMTIFENIPNAYLWILPGAGHSTLVSYKKEFNETIDDFFSKPYRTIAGKDRFR